MPAPSAAGRPAQAFAWLGGLVFVVALSYGGYAYGVRYGRPAPAGAGQAGPAAIDVVLFSAFALHHSLLARSGVKARLVRVIPPSLERSAFVWVSSVLFLVVCVAWRPVAGTLYVLEGPWRLVAYAIQLVGVWLTLRSAGVIDIWELAGIRQVLGRERPPVFKVIGPYHWVRHPIYLGWMCMTFGTPTLTATRLAFAVISTAYLAAAVPFEERSLIEVFGEEYRAYARRVKWRMVPLIY